MQKKLSCLCLVFSLLCLSPALSANTLHVIELQNYPAEDFLETIRPILLSSDQATVAGDSIILRADPSTIDIITSLAEKLDKPLRNLLILVSNNNDTTTDRGGYAISGQWGNDDISISNTRPQPGKGNHAHITINRGTLGNNRNGQQEVRAVEGQPAFIATGESLPVIQRQQYFDRYGNLVQTSNTDFKDVVRGFYVTARLQGSDRVHIRINYQNDNISHDKDSFIDTARLTTSLSGRVGEWITLGAVAESNQQLQSGFLQNRQNTKTSTGHYRIKIIPLD